MRVLHLTTEYPPVIFGGLGTAVGGWVTGSARSGMTVGVLLVDGPLAVEGTFGHPYGYITGAWPAAATQGTAPVVDREGITFFETPLAGAVEMGVQLTRRWRPDVIHLHTAMLWTVAQAIQARTGTPLVYHVHSVDRAEYEIGHEPGQWLAHSEAQEAAIASSDRLIALAPDEAALLATYYPHARERIRVVGNGIEDTPLAKRAVATRPETVSPLVLYSGRLVERKGIRELITAIPQVLDAAPGARFVFAGGPPQLTGAEVAAQWIPPELLATLQSRVHFTGWLRPDELARWYATADVLVVPSRYEPFGMVVLEGMLYGLPIVACNVGGPAEILTHGRTGLLVPPREPAALTDALIRLVGDSDLRRRMGNAAATEVRTTWSWPQRVAQMQSAYRELLDPLPAPTTAGHAKAA